MDHQVRSPSELLLAVVNELRKERVDKWDSKTSALSTPPKYKEVQKLSHVPMEELMPILLAYLDVQHNRHTELISALKDYMPNEREQFWRMMVHIPTSAIKALL